MIPSRPEIASSRSGKPRPLRFAVQPEAGESLPGLLSRATRLNVLESMFLPLENAGIRIGNPGRIGLIGPQVVEPLATTFGCPAEAVASRLLRYEGGPRAAADVHFGVAVVGRQDLRFDRRRISPITLLQRAHHLNWWLLAILPFCPVSGERLRDDCSECGALLGWRRSWGVGVCEHCEETVKPSAQPMLAAELLEDYRHFAGLVSPDQAVRATALERLPVTVGALSPKSLLDLCLRLGTVCLDEPLPYRRNELSRLDADTLTSIITNGIRLLRGWPHTVQDWAAAKSAALGAHARSRDELRVRLRGLAGRKRLDQAKLVQEALPDLFLSRLRSFAGPGKIMLTYETFSRLGINSRKLRSLERAGILIPSETLGERRRRLQFSAAEVEDLARCLRSASPASSLAWRLGIPTYGVEQLCAAGVVEPELHPGVVHLRAMLHVKNASARGLMAAVDEVGRRDPAPSATIPLAAASRQIGGRLKPWASIIAALLDGSLPCWRIGTGRIIYSLAVWPGDLTPFLTVEDNQSDIPAAPLVTKVDADEILNCTTRQIQDVEAQGLLRFHRAGKGLATEISATLALASQVVSCAEFALRTNDTPRRAAHRLRRLDIPRIAFGWDRALIARAGLLT